MKAITILKELSNQDIWVLLELGLEHTNIDGAISELEALQQRNSCGNCMTREEAKQLIYNASREDKSSPKDCIHLLSLHRFIDQIYNDHAVELNEMVKAKDEEIESLMFHNKNLKEVLKLLCETNENKDTK